MNIRINDWHIAHLLYNTFFFCCYINMFQFTFNFVIVLNAETKMIELLICSTPKLKNNEQKSNSTHACSWLCKCWTSSLRLSTIATNSANNRASRSRWASDFRQSSTDSAARSSRFNNAYFRSRSFSCSLQWSMMNHHD